MLALVQNNAVASFPVERYGGAERTLETVAWQLHALGVPFFVIVPGRPASAPPLTPDLPFEVHELKESPGLDALPKPSREEIIELQKREKTFIQAGGWEGGGPLHQAELARVYRANTHYGESVARFLMRHPNRDHLHVWSPESWSVVMAWLGRPLVRRVEQVALRGGVACGCVGWRCFRLLG